MRIPIGIERKPFEEYAAQRQRDIDIARRGGFRKTAERAQRRLDRQRAREQRRAQRADRSR